MVARVTDLLVHGDTFRSPEMRHEVPIGIPDPFLLAETDGTTHVLISSMEMPRLQGLGLELHAPEELGSDELRAQGLSRREIDDELHRRLIRKLGVRSVVVPDRFPLRLADVLRADGVEVSVGQQLFDERRRAKTAAELAGIRRAQHAAEEGMRVARDLLRRAVPGDGGLVADGDPLTVERLKAAMSAAFVANGATFDEFIVAHGPQAAIGHHMGEGRILSDEPVVIDVWPKDDATGCYADMTRTFVVGTPSDELAEWHRLTKAALDLAHAQVGPGASGRAIHEAVCGHYEAAGFPTQRTKEPGTALDRGFFHGLGHGVGLEVHEAPSLGLTSHDELVAGDVVTLEPGLYRPDLGGVRLEDLVLVTEDGAENLTTFPYELTP
jgi:Xaa-Pro aminopeptidase